MPYRLLRTVSGDFLLNEHLLKYVEVKRNVAALVRLPPAGGDPEPNVKMRVLEGSQMDEDQIRGFLEGVVEEEVEILRSMPKTRPLIELVRIFRKKLDETEYLKREKRKNEAKWVLWILDKRMKVRKGLKCVGRVYIPIDLLEDSLIDLNTGEEDRALTLLMRSDTGIRKRINDIKVGL